MAYAAIWVNRVDMPGQVDIDLNLTDGAKFRRHSFNFHRSPARVDQAFLDAIAAQYVAHQTNRDQIDENKRDMMERTLPDLQLFAPNIPDIDALISRMSLPYTRTQVREFILDQLATANRAALLALAERRFG